MSDFTVVDLSRLQFALTALYHFLFVPLTLGLSMLLVVMEATYVMTGLEIWKRMTKFWGLLFGINFAMGVATGITMEFQFGTNWAYYSHYVGDIFGAPLAIEGLMAFFLESTFVGLFFFGWDKLSKVGHLVVTALVAIGSNFSALWILIANAWMQNPVGAEFNPETMRMELTSIAAVILNPVAQSKFVHTVAAGYVTGSVFVLAISAWYLLRGRNADFARRSIAVAASFGLAAALSVVVLGDESGYAVTEHQKMKIAAIEGMWHTEEPPAPFTLVGMPDVENRMTHADLRIPWALGLVATRSVDEEMPGIIPLVAHAQKRIASGITAHAALERLRADPGDASARAEFDVHRADLGYGLLLLRYVERPADATAEDIERAAWSTVPNVPALFWSFRVMVALGFFFIALFAWYFWLSARHRIGASRAHLKVAICALPLPWIAAELGWIVAEYGRQPWAIEGVLPTFLGVSPTAISNVWLSLTGFVVFYTALLVVDIVLMRQMIRRGPEGLGYWPPREGRMPDYEVLRLVWWALLGALLVGFAVTDGFDLGVGALFRFLGRTDAERRALLESVEPVWEGNQVWLILGGGAVFAAWPLLYAASFSAFYLAMFLLLVALILRPVGFTFRNKLVDGAWRNAWDWALFTGGAVPALLFGVVFGNLFLGIPFHFDALARPVYTGGFLNLLHPFALLTGLVSLAMLVMHGAAYAAMKAEEPMAARARTAGGAAALLLLAAFTAAGCWLAWGLDGLRIVGEIDGRPLESAPQDGRSGGGGRVANFAVHRWMWAAPVLAYAGAVAAASCLRLRRDGRAFVASALAQTGVILTGGFGLFPFLLPSSSHAASSLTVWDASSSRLTLFIMLVVTLFFLPIVLAYTAWVFRVLRGRVSLAHVESQTGGY